MFHSSEGGRKKQVIKKILLIAIPCKKRSKTETQRTEDKQHDKPVRSALLLDIKTFRPFLQFSCP